MKILWEKGEILRHKAKAVVLGCFEDRPIFSLIEGINQALDGLINNIIKEKEFEGKPNQRLLIHTYSKIGAERIVLVGMGKEDEFSLSRLYNASGTAVKCILDAGISSFTNALHYAISPEQFKFDEVIQSIVEGSILGGYLFDVFKTKHTEDAPKKIKEMTLLVNTDTNIQALEKGIQYGCIIAEAVCKTRDIISMPANKATPTEMAKWAVSISKGNKRQVKCTILDEREIRRLGMEAFLAVSAGSIQPLKLIILEYKGGVKKEPPYILIGKGITFDSGGISLKPAKGMEEMKHDMAGGASVLGTLMAVSRLNLPVNIICLVPATENMPDGKAYKPGDVLKSMAGITIEIITTDAEGRLILADAMTFANRYKPKAVIDIATLTGACVIALGHEATGVMGNDPDLIKALIKAGEESGERLWELPLWDEYNKLLKSDIADIKNAGDGGAGTITGGMFLKKFASKSKWAHLDIAGTAWENKGRPCIPKGASGIGVRLFVRYLLNEIKANTTKTKR